MAPLTRQQIQTRMSHEKTRPTLRQRYENNMGLDPFIGWDSEGYDAFICAPDGISIDHRTMLFGCSVPALEPLTGPDLRSKEMLDYLLKVKNKWPEAIHISFAFDYDVNQILRDLSPRRRQMLIRYGSVTTPWGHCIEHIPRKMFIVRPLLQSRKTHKTITIYDIFSFFNCSYLSALKTFEIGDPDEIERISAGKSQRASFTLSDLSSVRQYWDTEISCLPLLGDSIRDSCYRSRFYITKWYGPGAIASYMLKQHGADKMMSKHNPVKIPGRVRYARKMAYAGGRFSQFGAGVFYGPVYTADLNSAYIAAMRQLPDLSNGSWNARVPSTLSYPVPDFALYRIRWDASIGGTGAQIRTDNLPMPLFRRTKRGLDWPAVVEGWYWGPEANLVANDPRARILECWEWSNPTPVFGWVEEEYHKRELIKKQVPYNPAERTYKWGLASMYGLFARRVGWDQSTHSAPNSHQLEWAGFITSWCRAEMQKLALPIALKGGLVSIDTDGITSLTPFDSSLTIGSGLGEWKVEKFHGLVQWQNGVYWLMREDGEWEQKSRGLQHGAALPREVAEQAIQDMEKRARTSRKDAGFSSPEHDLGEYYNWVGDCALEVERTNYVGYRQAMHGFHEERWRQWETKKFTYSLASGNHNISGCTRCRALAGTFYEKFAGLNVDDYPLHDVQQYHFDVMDDMSEPHRLPWEESPQVYDDPEGALMHDEQDPDLVLIFPDYHMKGW